MNPIIGLLMLGYSSLVITSPNNQLLVRAPLTSDFQTPLFQTFLQKNQCQIKQHINALSATILSCKQPIGTSYKQQFPELSSMSMIQEKVIPIQTRNIIHTRSLLSNDPYSDQQWYLAPSLNDQNSDASINVNAAWTITTGLNQAHSPITVAIIDDGFDLNHEDLHQAYMRDGSSIIIGQNFSNWPTTDNDPSAGKYDAHGTQLAGLVAATRDNNLGITGVCPDCNILPIKLYGHTSSSADLFTTGSAAAAAIVWAVDHNADVILCAWGPLDNSFYSEQYWPLPTIVADAITYASNHGRNGLGTIIVWAAGNGGERINFDAWASNQQVISVGSITNQGVWAYYSDWGASLDIVTPSSGGTKSLYTTSPTEGTLLLAAKYTDTFGGTSGSAALATGIIALTLAANNRLTMAQVHQLIHNHSFPIDINRGPMQASSYDEFYGAGLLTGNVVLQASSLTGSCSDNEVCGNNSDDDCDGITDPNHLCAICIPHQAQEECNIQDLDCDGHTDGWYSCFTQKPLCAPCDSATICDDDLHCQYLNGSTYCLPRCSLSTASCPNGMRCTGTTCVPDELLHPLGCFTYSCTNPEWCNGHDENCNNINDEHVQFYQDSNSIFPCSLIDHNCSLLSITCIQGVATCSVGASYELYEYRCDNIDNDCDGYTDELCSNHESKLSGCSQNQQLSLVWYLLFFIVLPFRIFKFFHPPHIQFLKP